LAARIAGGRITSGYGRRARPRWGAAGAWELRPEGTVAELPFREPPDREGLGTAGTGAARLPK